MTLEALHGALAMAALMLAPPADAAQLAIGFSQIGSRSALR